jgi:apolipoprotein N-acyltransferase
MIGKSQTSAWLSCGLSGLLLVLAFAPIGWSWCGWLALGPAWLALRESASVQRQPIRHGYLVGLIFVIGNFWWIATAVPLGFVFMVAVLSFYPALWFLLVVRLLPVEPNSEPRKFSHVFGTTILAAAFWVTLEWLRSWFLTGFNWNELGVSQTPNACIRQLAAVGGVPLLSFVLALFGILFGEAISELRPADAECFRRAGPAAICCLIIPAAAWLYGWHHLQEEKGAAVNHVLTYACIQPNIARIPYRTGTPAEWAPLESNAFHLQEELSAMAVQSRQPDLLIWPEAITAQRLGVDPLLGQVIGNVMRHIQGDFLLGGEELQARKVYNCAYLFRHGAPLPQKYRKVQLVVFSEYSPFGQALTGLESGFTPGSSPASFALSGSPVTLSPFICFEETKPEAANAAARLHPDFFVVLTNDNWFVGAAGIWAVTQQLQNGLLRTVEHDRPMIRCANNGISCEIDPAGELGGRVHGSLGEAVGVPGILAGTLALETPENTLYELWGNWVLRACQVITIFSGSLYLFRTRKLDGFRGGTY